jgi:hypothetical protein
VTAARSERSNDTVPAEWVRLPVTAETEPPETVKVPKAPESVVTEYVPSARLNEAAPKIVATPEIETATMPGVEASGAVSI